MLGKKFSKFDNFIFDLDGTFWYWTELIPKAREVFQVLKKSGKNVHFLTNNTILTREGFAKKLRNFGVETNSSRIINPSLVAVKLFKNKKVLCVAEGLATELRRAGIKVADSKPDVVVVSEDRSLTFDKLARASEAVTNGAKFYKTAVGGVWIYGKKRLPGTGAIAASIEMCSGRRAELIGKPSDYMKNIIKKMKLNPEKTIVFGDEHESDVVFGNSLGFKTVLVLTGRDKRLAARGEEKPKMVLRSIADILKV